jgi:hypothetical protein
MIEALANLKTEILEGVQETVRDAKAEIIKGVRETVRDFQTEVLKAFFAFQESTDLRIRAVEVKLSNTDVGLTERMSVIERRLAEIEKKLFVNRPAA